LGAAHGCEFSIEDVQGGAALSDKQLEGVAGGAAYIKFDGVSKLRLSRGSKGRFSFEEIKIIDPQFDGR